MNNTNLLDKVLSYKRRVWTVYGVCTTGVHCYQGLKPFPSFSYREDSEKYSTFKKNTTYIPIEDVVVIDGEEIDKALKKMVAADKKPLNRKKAIEFFVHLTGHSKSLVSKSIEDRHNGFIFSPGWIRYDLWKAEGVLMLSHNTNNGYTNISYFDFITFEPNDLKYDESREAYKQEILDNAQ